MGHLPWGCLVCYPCRRTVGGCTWKVFRPEKGFCSQGQCRQPGLVFQPALAETLGLCLGVSEAGPGLDFPSWWQGVGAWVVGPESSLTDQGISSLGGWVTVVAEPGGFADSLHQQRFLPGFRVLSLPRSSLLMPSNRGLYFLHIIRSCFREGLGFEP